MQVVTEISICTTISTGKKSTSLVHLIMQYARALERVFYLVVNSCVPNPFPLQDKCSGTKRYSFY